MSPQSGKPRRLASVPAARPVEKSEPGPAEKPEYKADVTPATPVKRVEAKEQKPEPKAEAKPAEKAPEKAEKPEPKAEPEKKAEK